MERNIEIKNLREEGKTLKYIGDKFSITKERVRQICKKMGVENPRYYKPFPQEDLTLRALKAKSTYPSNVVCISADGHMIFISDGEKNWVEIYNQKLKKAISEIYSLQSWIE